MTRKPALKVYCMPAGFHDAIVAAPSQKAALKAWGTTTDLFAAGRAHVVSNEMLAAEALRRPGEVIKLSRGDTAAILGPDPTAPAKKRSTTPSRRAGRRPEAPPPDRSELDEAERALAAAERDLDEELAAISAEKQALDARERAARASGEERLERARAARTRAEDFYAAAVKRLKGRRPA